MTLSAIPTEPIAIGGTFSSTPTLKAGEQTLSGKTITWSSDNDKVATVDAATGIVTGVLQVKPTSLRSLPAMTHIKLQRLLMKS